MASNNTICVLNELAQVYDLARKLREDLYQPSEIEQCRTIADEIIFSVERAICMVKSKSGGGSQFSPGRGEEGDNQQMIKKRKMLPTWTCQVPASTLSGSEGLPYDGYSWRKYGQKDILNTKHPRAYYRCSHSKKQGCLAIKQVQISDDNPSLFEVTYRGSHTCSSMMQPQDLPHQIFLDQQNNNRSLVKNERLVFEIQDSTSSTFFPSTPLNPEEDLFCSSPNLASCFLASFSSALLSPTTSESNCIPSSPCQKTSQDMDFMLRTGEMDAYFPIETSNCFEWNSAE